MLPFRWQSGLASGPSEPVILYGPAGSSRVSRFLTWGANAWHRIMLSADVARKGLLAPRNSSA